MSSLVELSAVIRREGSVFVAWAPELDVASQGATVEDALANLKEAVGLYLEDADAASPEGPVFFTRFEVEDGPDSACVGA